MSYREDIMSDIFPSPSLLLMWEQVVGGNLRQDLAFDLLRMLALSLWGSFGKGILLRRLNAATESISTTVMNVGIRAKVTR